jgi:hypothetical protein
VFASQYPQIAYIAVYAAYLAAYWATFISPDFTFFIATFTAGSYFLGIVGTLGTLGTLGTAGTLGIAGGAPTPAGTERHARHFGALPPGMLFGLAAMAAIALIFWAMPNFSNLLIVFIFLMKQLIKRRSEDKCFFY